LSGERTRERGWGEGVGVSGREEEMKRGWRRGEWAESLYEREDKELREKGEEWRGRERRGS
jgi:hypothetical protein